MESLVSQCLKEYSKLLQEEDEIYFYLQGKIERKEPKEIDPVEEFVDIYVELLSSEEQEIQEMFEDDQETQAYIQAWDKEPEFVGNFLMCFN